MGTKAYLHAAGQLTYGSKSTCILTETKKRILL